MPKSKWTTIIVSAIVFVSFFVIVGGNVYCIVNGAPTLGYTRGSDGQYKLSWINSYDPSSQFVIEGVIASIFFTIAAASMIAIFYTLQLSHEPQGVHVAFQYFGYSAPFLLLASFFLFKTKFPSYSPALLPR